MAERPWIRLPKWKGMEGALGGGGGGGSDGKEGCLEVGANVRAR